MQILFFENLNSVSVCWRKPADVEIAEDNFNQLVDNATLYVPAGTAERYLEHAVWRKFANIVEASPISVGDITARYGSRTSVPIYLKNEEQMAGLQFRLTLPEGVTLAEKDGEIIISTTERTEGFAIMGQKDLDEENSYIVVLLSFDGAEISGNEGAIMNLRVDISDTLSLGDYTISIEDIVLTTNSFMEHVPEGSYAELTVTDMLLGDVNGDGIITVTDAVSVVNYILRNPSSNFIAVAADMNGDGIINVTDAVSIVNNILNQSVSHHAKMKLASEVCLDPQ